MNVPQEALSPELHAAPATVPCTQAGPAYRIKCVTPDWDAPERLQAWKRMLASSNSPEKIYQSPAFFRYVRQAESSRCDLFAIEHADGGLAGIVPVRFQQQPLAFQLGARALFTAQVPVIILTGSEPMFACGDELLMALMSFLLERYPECEAVLLPACRRESFDRLAAAPGFGTYVVNGWRECHTMQLPASFDAYLAKFSAKKRYNLQRQIRQLEQEAGAAGVTRIDQPGQVPAVMQALATELAPPDFVGLVSEEKFRALADNGLLLCYIVSCGGAPVALILGTQACGVWHVHNIFCDRSYLHLSIGTSAVHLALQDAIGHGGLVAADFGFGTPKQEFRSTHQLKKRGYVLLYPRGRLVGLLFAAHGAYDHARSVLVRVVKDVQRRWGKRMPA